MEQVSGTIYQIALATICIGIASYLILRKNWLVYILLLGGFLLSMSAITRDSYLHPWDERYHALVAQNVMESPLEPKLYKDVLLDDFPHTEWYRAHTWLHKQPLFLWQMALTMSIFGNDLVGMRLSSALMLLLFAFSVYKTCQIYFPKSSFWVTLLASTQPYLLLLTSGLFGMDHNDIAFIAWVSVGFWGFVAYLKNGGYKWVFLVGMAVGFAMLTKWLAGSFILCLWGLHLLVSKNFSKREWLNLLITASIAALLFISWQLYCYQAYPEEFLKEWEYNSRHLTEVIEQHDQPFTFHFEIWMEYFATLGALFLIAIILIKKRAEHVKLLVSIILGIFAVMIFYSFAKTKLNSYTLFLLPAVLFVPASLFEKIRLRSVHIVLGITISLWVYTEFRNIYLYNVQNEEYASRQREIRKLSHTLANQLPEKAVIFNVPPMEFVEFMFYTERLAYEFIPRKEQLEKLQNLGYKSIILLPDSAEINPDLRQMAEVVKADIW